MKTYLYLTLYVVFLIISCQLEKEGSRNKYGGRKSIVFDWDGNYVRSFQADVDILSFCVDEKNNIIYASCPDENDETGGGFGIFQFNISKK